MTWTALKVLLAVALYGMLLGEVLNELHFMIAFSGTPGDSNPLFLIVAGPWFLGPPAVLHGLVVLVNSRDFPLLRRVASTFLASVVAPPLLYLVTGLVIGFLPTSWANIVSGVIVFGAWFLLPIVATYASDRVLHPARRWGRSNTMLSCLVSALFLLTGCATQPPLPPISPLDQLPSVHLGIRGAALRAQRPDAVHWRYGILIEQLGEYQASYVLAQAGGSAPLPWRRLWRVTTLREFAGDSMAAQEEWLAHVRNAMTRLGPPQRCSAGNTMPELKQGVAWDLPRQALEISLLRHRVNWRSDRPSVDSFRVEVKAVPPTSVQYTGPCGADGLPAESDPDHQ